MVKRVCGLLLCRRIAEWFLEVRFLMKPTFLMRTRGGQWREDTRWSLVTRIGCENVFLVQDRKGDKGGEVEMINMFVQRAEDRRGTSGSHE